MPKASLATAPSAITERSKGSLATVIRDIMKGIRKGFECSMEVSLNLKTIRDDELYSMDEEKYSSFKEFVEQVFPDYFDYKRACQLINIAEIYQAIRERLEDKRRDGEDDGVSMPISENQLRPLLTFREQPSKAAELYERSVLQAQKTGALVTGDYIRDFVRFGMPQAQSMPEVEISSEPVSDTAWADDDTIDFSSAPTKRRSAAAAQTLDRIRALENEDFIDMGSAEAIETEQKIISDSDLELWGRYDNGKFLQVARLVFGANLTVLRASQIIGKKLDADTFSKVTLEEFLLKAMAVGGKASIQFMGYEIVASPL